MVGGFGVIASSHSFHSLPKLRAPQPLDANMFSLNLIQKSE